MPYLGPQIYMIDFAASTQLVSEAMSAQAAALAPESDTGARIQDSKIESDESPVENTVLTLQAPARSLAEDSVQTTVNINDSLGPSFPR